jgi:hypothetical protein
MSAEQFLQYPQLACRWPVLLRGLLLLSIFTLCATSCKTTAHSKQASPLSRQAPAAASSDQCKVFISVDGVRGKQIVPFADAPPKDWPTAFAPPPDSLILADDDSHMKILIVKADQEAICQHCRVECERLGITVAREDATDIDGMKVIILTLKKKSQTMYINLQPPGKGIRTEPSQEADKYVMTIFDYFTTESIK